jgi:hypothetical protein
MTRELHNFSHGRAPLSAAHSLPSCHRRSHHSTALSLVRHNLRHCRLNCRRAVNNGETTKAYGTSTAGYVVLQCNRSVGLVSCCSEYPRPHRGNPQKSTEVSRADRKKTSGRAWSAMFAARSGAKRPTPRSRRSSARLIEQRANISVAALQFPAFC